MRPSARAAFLAVFPALLWAAHGAAFARGAAEDVAAGNAAYSSGDFPRAVGLYDRAQHRAHGSVVPLLDFGIALYAKGDYADALAAFQGIQTTDGGIAAEADYDQGSALARLGQKAEKDDPKAALDFYQRSVAAYQRALAIDAGLSAAATNIEVVREWIKKLKDAQSQSQAQQPQQDQGSGSSQNAPNQGAPGQNAQAPNNQAAKPAPGQTTQTPGNPIVSNDQNGTPLNETAEQILQEERDRRQAEATAGGRATDESPNW